MSLILMSGLELDSWGTYDEYSQYPIYNSWMAQKMTKKKTF